MTDREWLDSHEVTFNHTYGNGSRLKQTKAVPKDIALEYGERIAKSARGTCCVVEAPYYRSQDKTEFQLSCGHCIEVSGRFCPNYCTWCGAKVVR